MRPLSPPPVLEPSKLFDDNYDDTNARYELSTMDAVRTAALIMYGRFIANINGEEPDDEEAKNKTQYISVQETEAIVRENSFVSGDTYAIGGDTQEEVKKNINELLNALLDRIMSNVLQEGVKQELLDCQYDTDTNDFAFSVTDKGKEKVDEIRRTRENGN